jgi:hypothetical protein
LPTSFIEDLSPAAHDDPEPALGGLVLAPEDRSIEEVQAVLDIIAILLDAGVGVHRAHIDGDLPGGDAIHDAVLTKDDLFDRRIIAQAVHDHLRVHDRFGGGLRLPGALLDQGPAPLPGAIPNGDVEPGLHQIRGHAPSHDSQTEIGDSFHSGLLVSARSNPLHHARDGRPRETRQALKPRQRFAHPRQREPANTVIPSPGRPQTSRVRPP